MTSHDARAQVLRYWREKARRALGSAQTEFEAGQLDFAVNRAYYACFYALSAALLREGRKFSRHAGVRSALHECLIKPGRLEQKRGGFYDQLFEDRGEADYAELAQLSAEKVAQSIRLAQTFVLEMERLAEA